MKDLQSSYRTVCGTDLLTGTLLQKGVSALAEKTISSSSSSDSGYKMTSELASLNKGLTTLQEADLVSALALPFLLLLSFLFCFG